MTAAGVTEFKRRFHFTAGLRFELFYALQAMTDPESRIHTKWRQDALASLPKEFEKSFQEIGGSPLIWPVIADTLKTKPTTLSFEELISEMAQQDVSKFQKEILFGTLHDDRLAEKLLLRKIGLADALAKVPKVKREWLSFVGLYPYDPDEPMVVAKELLITSPVKFRRAAIRTIELFWQSSFKVTWNRLQPQFQKSVDEKERLFESCSFEEFSRQALLRIEVDEKKEIIKAARGGYELPFDELKEAHLLPSAFNDKRYWTAFEDGKKTVVYFPYFDPAITLYLEVAGGRSDLLSPELDPAMIFKALGDTTRYAMVKIIAKRPTSSVELAMALAVSKPTISHHVHALRDAGLITETYLNGSVLLSLKRDVLEALSDLTINRLFGTNKIENKEKLKWSKS